MWIHGTFYSDPEHVLSRHVGIKSIFFTDVDYPSILLPSRRTLFPTNTYSDTVVAVTPQLLAAVAKTVTQTTAGLLSDRDGEGEEDAEEY